VRVRLLTALHGLPVGFAMTGAKTDERQVLLDVLDDHTRLVGRAGQIITGNRNYGKDFEAHSPGPG
jgi:hypothetical protein